MIVGQYEAGLGGVDFNRYAVILQSLVQQQDPWALSQGQIGQGLIQIYRGLGGGWQIRLGDNANVFRNLPPVINIPAFAPEEIPASDAIAPPVPPQLQGSESTPADQLPAIEDAPSVVPLPPAPSDAAPADQIPPSPPPATSPGAATTPADELPSAESRRLPQSMADMRSSRRRGR